jgi:hypothetical protein
MTPKEKADELYSKYDNLLNKDFGNPIVFDNQIKQCALIAVDEMQQLIKDLSSCKNRFIYIIDEMNYWNEVKQEIEKL